MGFRFAPLICFASFHIFCLSKRSVLEVAPTLKLYGSVHSTAYYFADSFIGAPQPQRQSLIVDTGSAVTGFGCDDCSYCGTEHIDDLFVRHESKTAQKYPCVGNPVSHNGCRQCFHDQDDVRGHCGYSVAYLEGSELHGKWYQDFFWLGHGMKDYTGCTECSVTGVPLGIPFGCHLQETHLFIDQLASGIIGLEVETTFGPRTFIDTAVMDLHSLLEPDSYLPLYGFSMCLSEYGGVMSVGRTNSELHVQSTENKRLLGDVKNDKPRFFKSRKSQENQERPSSTRRLVYESYPAAVDFSADIKIEESNNSELDGIQWTDIVRSDGYTVDLIEISIGGTKFNSYEIRSLVDSGTTITYVPPTLYVDLLLAVSEGVEDYMKSGKYDPSKYPKRTESQSDVSHMTGASYKELQNYLDKHAKELEAMYNIKGRRLSESLVGKKVVSEIGRAKDLIQRLRILEEKSESGKIANRRGRKLSEVEEKEIAAVEEQLLFNPSAPHRSAKIIKMKSFFQEECWFVPGRDHDLVAFPNITLKFGGGATFVWEPRAYLYAKGDFKVRCFGIGPTASENIGNEQNQIVLGSTFFINHDMVFDVEDSLFKTKKNGKKNGKIGFIKAKCPEYRFREERDEEFVPYAAESYIKTLKATI